MRAQRLTSTVKKRVIRTNQQNTTFKSKLQGITGKLSALKEPQLLVKLAHNDQVPYDLVKNIIASSVTKRKSRLSASNKGSHLVSSTPHPTKSREKLFFNETGSSSLSPINLRASASDGHENNGEINADQRGVPNEAPEQPENHDSSVIYVGTENAANVTFRKRREQVVRSPAVGVNPTLSGNPPSDAHATTKSKIPLRAKSQEKDLSKNAHDVLKPIRSEPNVTTRSKCTERRSISAPPAAETPEKYEKKSQKTHCSITRSRRNLTNLSKNDRGDCSEQEVALNYPVAPETSKEPSELRKNPRRGRSESVLSPTGEEASKREFAEGIGLSPISVINKGGGTPKKPRSRPEPVQSPRRPKTAGPHTSCLGFTEDLLKSRKEATEANQALEIANDIDRASGTIQEANGDLIGSGASPQNSIVQNCPGIPGNQSGINESDKAVTLHNLIEEIKLKKSKLPVNRTRSSTSGKDPPEPPRNLTLADIVTEEELANRKKGWQDIFTKLEHLSIEADKREAEAKKGQFDASKSLSNPSDKSRRSKSLVPFADRRRFTAEVVPAKKRRSSLHSVIDSISSKAARKARQTVNKEIQTSALLSSQAVGSSNDPVIVNCSRKRGRPISLKVAQCETSASSNSDVNRPNIFDSVEEGNELDLLLFSGSQDGEVSFVEKPWRFEHEHGSRELSDNVFIPMDFIRSELDMTYGRHSQKSSGSNEGDTITSELPSRRSTVRKLYSKKKIDDHPPSVFKVPSEPLISHLNRLDTTSSEPSISLGTTRSKRKGAGTATKQANKAFESSSQRLRSQTKKKPNEDVSVEDDTMTKKKVDDVDIIPNKPNTRSRSRHNNGHENDPNIELELVVNVTNNCSVHTNATDVKQAKHPNKSKITKNAEMSSNKEHSSKSDNVSQAKSPQKSAKTKPRTRSRVSEALDDSGPSVLPNLDDELGRIDSAIVTVPDGSQDNEGETPTSVDGTSKNKRGNPAAISPAQRANKKTIAQRSKTTVSETPDDNGPPVLPNLDVASAIATETDGSQENANAPPMLVDGTSSKRGSRRAAAAISPPEVVRKKAKAQRSRTRGSEAPSVDSGPSVLPNLDGELGRTDSAVRRQENAERAPTSVDGTSTKHHPPRGAKKDTRVQRSRTRVSEAPDDSDPLVNAIVTETDGRQQNVEAAATSVDVAPAKRGGRRGVAANTPPPRAKKKTSKPRAKTRVTMPSKVRLGDVDTSNILRSTDTGRPQRNRKPVRNLTDVDLDSAGIILMHFVRGVLKPMKKTTKGKDKRTKRTQSSTYDSALEGIGETVEEDPEGQPIEKKSKRRAPSTKGRRKKTKLTQNSRELDQSLTRDVPDDDAALEDIEELNDSASAPIEEQNKRSAPSTKGTRRKRTKRTYNSTESDKSTSNDLPPVEERLSERAVRNNTANERSSDSERPGPSRVPERLNERSGLPDLTNKWSGVLDRSSNVPTSGRQLLDFEASKRRSSVLTDDDFVRHVVAGEVYNLRYISRLPARESYVRLGNLSVYETVNDPEGCFSAGYMILNVNDSKRPTTGHKYSFIYSVISGSAQVQVGDKRGVANKGNFFVIPKDLSYSITNGSSEEELILSYTRIKRGDDK